jgi:hypothetical protein
MFESTYNRDSEVARDQFGLAELEYWRNGTSLRPNVQSDPQAWEAGSAFRLTSGQLGIALLTVSLLVIVLATGIL